MANPQKENGYTAIANEIMEHLALIKLTDYESRILHALWRKTYGWNKKSDVISLSQWSQSTRISTHHIPRTLQLLQSRNLIIINKIEPKVIEYSFQKNYEQWDKKSELDLIFEEQIKESKLALVLPNEVLPNQVLPNEVLPNQVLPNEDSGSTQPGTQVVPNQVDTITIKTILQNNTPNGDGNGHHDIKSLNQLKEELENAANKNGYLGKIFNDFHKSSPQEDKKQCYARFGKMVKEHNNDYFRILSLIYKTQDGIVAIEGSHLNYIEGMLKGNGYHKDEPQIPFAPRYKYVN